MNTRKTKTMTYEEYCERRKALDIKITFVGEMLEVLKKEAAELDKVEIVEK